MPRRWSKPATALDQSKGDLARRESEVRDQVEKLERIIEDAPRVAEELSRRQREELLMRANEGGSRLDVSLALQDRRYGLAGAAPTKRKGSLRKQRREGRIIFLVLVLALALAVIWLASHLHF